MFRGRVRRSRATSGVLDVLEPKQGVAFRALPAATLPTSRHEKTFVVFSVENGLQNRFSLHFFAVYYSHFSNRGQDRILRLRNSATLFIFKLQFVRLGTRIVDHRIICLQLI